MKTVSTEQMEALTTFTRDVNLSDFEAFFGEALGGYMYHKFAVTYSGCLMLFYSRLDSQNKLRFTIGVNSWIRTNLENDGTK